MPPTRIAKVCTGLLVAFGLAACNRTPEPGLARGEELFDTCVPCHGADGAGNPTLRAPAIAGLPQWYVENQLRSFQVGWRGGNPWDTVGIRMKSMSRSLDLEGDVESVAEYVSTMEPTRPAATVSGDLRAGESTFAVCAACHGIDGSGNELLNAPPLAGASDWYLLAQLHKFKDGWRGADPEDVVGATMRPNSVLLDDEAMLDVVAYIQTLQPSREAP